VLLGWFVERVRWRHGRWWLGSGAQQQAQDVYRHLAATWVSGEHRGERDQGDQGDQQFDR
jgi:hypothetical protein